MEQFVDLIESIKTHQGEGPDCGTSMLLLRFKTCNKHCPYCDTLVKMRNSISSEYKFNDIQNVLNESKAGLLLTGGEPTFSTNYQDSIDLLNDLNYPIANVESNGYNLRSLIKEVDPSKNIKYMYSPKIFNQVDFDSEVSNSEQLINIENVYFKIVITPDDNLTNNYLYFLSKYEINQRVYLMPEGSTREKLIENSGYVFDLCEEYKFNFSSRDHIIYGFI